MAARAGGEIGFGDLAAVGDDLAPGRVGGLVGGRGLAGRALVDLAAGVVVEVEAVAADLHGERVGAGRHRLRPQRRLRPGGRRLVGDHALHVLVDRDRVDRVQRAGVGVGRDDLERAAVGADPGDADPPGAGRPQPAPAVGERPARWQLRSLTAGARPVRLVFAVRCRARLPQALVAPLKPMSPPTMPTRTRTTRAPAASPSSCPGSSGRG